jgi:hypothetical protein
MLKKDSMLLGIVIGIVVTVGSYFILTGLNIWISSYFFNRAPIFRKSTIEVIAIFMNVFPFRYYMLKLGKDYTGRGILLVTFIIGLVYFFYYVDYQTPS